MTQFDVATDAQTLLTIRIRQLNLYAKVEDLCRRQNDLIKRGETETLMTLLADKQKCIQDIEAQTAQALPHQARCEAAIDQLPAAIRGALENKMTEIRAVLESIMTIEEEGRTILEDSCDETKQKISRAQQGKMVARAYGMPKPQRGAQYKDKTG